ncbi:MAG: hypothetical protein Q4A82_03590 [Corynebacterium sp.]|nr:hypothetical protein [Corynebacterium sp.]
MARNQPLTLEDIRSLSRLFHTRSVRIMLLVRLAWRRAPGACLGVSLEVASSLLVFFQA